MPFCPSCRYEYTLESGVSTCPDCDQKLVASLPAEEPDLTDLDSSLSYRNWITLVRFTSYEYTEMVVDIFRSKQIPVVVNSGAGHFGVTGQMGMSSARPLGGGFSIMVPEQFSADADLIGEEVLGDVWRDSRLE